VTTRKLALAALTVLDLPHPDLVSVAAKVGYSHVGLRLVPVAGQPYLHPLDPAAIEERLADTGLGVLDVEVFRLEEETKVGDYEQAIAVSARLGASQILVHGADENEARLIDSFGRLCDLAGKYNLGVNLEPMPWVAVSTVAKAKRILEKAERKNGAFLPDAIHFFRADNRLDELRGVPMNYVQFCDARAGRPADMQEMIRQARFDRLPPGEGALPLEDFLKEIPKQLTISLEVPMTRKLPPLDRAELVYRSTLKVLERCVS
jgi:sugar phosphate isomerase/epimerase